MRQTSRKAIKQKRKPTEQIAYEDQAEILRALAHPARLQLLSLLSRRPACVSELVERTGYRQPYVSQNLAVLRDAGLVAGTRDGLSICYQVTCPNIEQLLLNIRQTCRLNKKLAEE